MDDHEQLIKEAEKLAEGMKQGDKIHYAFVYSYVGNQERRDILNEFQLVWKELKHIKWIVCSVFVVMVLGIVANLLT